MISERQNPGNRDVRECFGGVSFVTQGMEGDKEVVGSRQKWQDENAMT